MAYDPAVARFRGPGVVKARSMPLLLRRDVSLIRSSDDHVRELFEAADVISEGALRLEASGTCYYGTTSVLLLPRSRGGLIPDHQQAEVAARLNSDPHARVRAVRIACREAQVRSRAAIGLLRAELRVSQDGSGVRFDVEVEAQLEQHGTRGRSRRA